MLAALRHRGPDDDGIWGDGRGGPVVGHRRLSILDPSPAGHQPMVSPDGRYVIVLNGEIYNYRTLKSDLAGRGISFRTGTDTEVLLQGYAAWGEQVLERLVGMYAFAIWDVEDRSLLLARDRFGEKPLYIASREGRFAFASELGALESVPWVDRSLDREALSLYLQYQYVPAPHSIIAGVRKLPPAHAMRVGPGLRTRCWRYWDPVQISREPQLRISRGDAEEHLSSLLDESIRGQMVADVPLGAFLSGGIDSSLVVSRMVQQSSDQVETFTIGFDEAAFDESRHAQEVANHLGTRHTCERLDSQRALALVRVLPRIYGEPFADSSAIPTRLVAEVARRRVTVSLSGDGGDELFGGYARYNWFRRTSLLSSLPSRFRPSDTLLARLPTKAERLAALIGTRPVERYRQFVSLFSQDEARRLTGVHAELHEYSRAWASVDGQGRFRNGMLADISTYLPGAILAKVDRAAMSVSLETRAPLLDHRIAEFALRLPDEYMVGKPLLKALAERAVPRRILDRPKQGFGVPVARWLRTELKELLLDVVRPESLRRVGIADSEFVSSLMDAHLSGRRDYSAKLWAILVLCLWGRR